MKNLESDQSDSGFALPRVLACIVLFVILPALLVADVIPPAWWSARGVTNGDNPNDYAAVNQGQLKKMATAAYDELQAHLPGGAGGTDAPSGTFPGGTGYKLNALIGSWTGTAHAPTNDYAVANIGQVKAVAKLFYDRLIEVGYTDQYPWQSSTNTVNDYAVANIGQVKNLFSFDVTYDSDSNGLPDWWEMYYFGAIGQTGTAASPSGNGLTILQSYQQALDPYDFYKGISPTITIVSGTNQTGTAGVMLSSPLVVQVTGTSGSPMVNAPVWFAVSVGNGLLAPDNSGTSTLSGAQLIHTGTDGKAQVWFQQPFDAGFTSTLSAYAENSKVDFNEATADDSGPPTAPGNVAAVIQADGSVYVTWSDNSDNENGFVIQRSDDSGATWTAVGTVDKNSTSFMVAANDAGSGGASQFNVMATAAGGSSAPSSPGLAIKLIPTVNFMPIDISGGTNSPDVINVALSDDNKATYCFISGSSPVTFGYNTISKCSKITVSTWQSGTVASSNIVTTGTTPITYGTYSGTFVGSLSIDDTLFSPFTNNYADTPLYPAPNNILLTPQGGAYGTERETITATYNSFDMFNIYSWSPGTSGTSGTAEISGTMQLLEFTDSSFATGTTNLVISNTNNIIPSTAQINQMGANVIACSQAGYAGTGFFATSQFYTATERPDQKTFRAAFVRLTGSVSGTTVFYSPELNPEDTTGTLQKLADLLPTGITKIAMPFMPTAMNDNGVVIGITGTVGGGSSGTYPAYYWYNGMPMPLPFGTNCTANAINNSNMVIGTTTVSGTRTGMLWSLDSGTIHGYTMQSLVPSGSAGYPAGEVTNIIPFAISNEDSNHNMFIVCSATFMEQTVTGTTVTTGTNYGTIILNVSGTNPTQGSYIHIAKSPVGINLETALKNINKYGVITALCDPEGDTGPTAVRHAFVLLPVFFMLTSGNDPTMSEEKNNNCYYDNAWNLTPSCYMRNIPGLTEFCKWGFLQDSAFDAEKDIGSKRLICRTPATTYWPEGFIPDLPSKTFSPALPCPILHEVTAASPVNGYYSFQVTDQPGVPINANELLQASSTTDNNRMRFYLCVSFGSASANDTNSATVVSEIDSFYQACYITNKYPGATTIMKLYPSPLSYVVPAARTSLFGQVPSHQPVEHPDSTTSYAEWWMGQRGNWKPVDQ